MNAMAPITAAPEPTVLDSVKRVMAKRSHREQVELIRFLADELSFSYGADKIAHGCDRVVSDLDDEQITIDCGGTLPRDAWNYARMEDTFSAPLNQITGRV